MDINVDNADSIIINKRYELYETLGRGGMGVVYKVKDRLTGKPVALKQVALPADPLSSASPTNDSDLTLSLAQEFRALASLRHPNIISVYDFGFDRQRQPYFTMEYLDGGQTILDAGRGLPLEAKAGLVLQMLQALSYLHRRGILHRDLKPANALILDGQLKLLDFGLSIITSRTMVHMTQTTVGTMAFMAPEIFQGAPYSQASDLYAIGLIAFQLFTGQFPYDESNIATLLNEILNKQVDASSFGLAEDLANVLNKLMAKMPEERYGDSGEVVRDLYLAVGLASPPEPKEIRESFLQAARFVGRDAELSHLSNRLTGATRGQGSAVLIGGESGVGKTRLLDELRIQALVQGVLVLQGQAISVGRSPYHVWRDVFHTLALYADLDNEQAAVFKTLVPDIEGLLNRDVTESTSINPQAAQERLSRTLSQALIDLEEPVLIVLDDLQWAGNESTNLLKNLALTITNRPIMLAGAFRDDRPFPSRDDLASIEILPLSRLKEAEIADLSASMLGQVGRDQQIVNLLKEETEGNAFFLVEAVRGLAEEAGQLDRISATTLPENVTIGGIRAILNRRLNQVPEEARPLLQLASVASRVLDLTLLRTLEPEADLDGWLATCTDVAVLEAYGETWRFSHDKLREEIKERLSHDLHHELHRRVAEGLESVYPDDPQQAAALAHHWTVAGDSEKGLHYAQIAGHQAAQSNANEEAIAFFQQALEMLMTQPQTEERDRQELALLIQLGPPQMAVRGFNDPEVMPTYTRARELAIQTGQIDLLFQATWGQWEFYVHGHIDELDTAEELLQHLFDLASQSGDDDLILESHHSGWTTAYAHGDAATMADHVKKGLAIYNRGLFSDHIRVYGHDPGVCAYANGAISFWLLGYPDRALQSALKGLALAEELGHPFSTAESKWGITLITLFREENQAALMRAKEFVAFSKEHGFSDFARVATLFHRIALAQTGAESEQVAQIRKVYELALTNRNFILWPWVLSKFLNSCLSLGALNKGLQAVDRELADHAITGQRLYESEVRRAYGELLLAKDEKRVSEAEAQFQLALDIARRQSARSLQLRAVMSMARLWRKQGKGEEARQLLAASYEWFTEGFDTADLIAAKNLLEELQ